jgi:hypothetical protein
MYTKLFRAALLIIGAHMGTNQNVRRRKKFKSIVYLDNRMIFNPKKELVTDFLSNRAESHRHCIRTSRERSGKVESIEHIITFT